MAWIVVEWMEKRYKRGATAVPAPVRHNGIAYNKLQESTWRRVRELVRFWECVFHFRTPPAFAGQLRARNGYAGCAASQESPRSFSATTLPSSVARATLDPPSRRGACATVALSDPFAADAQRSRSPRRSRTLPRIWGTGSPGVDPAIGKPYQGWTPYRM